MLHQENSLSNLTEKPGHFVYSNIRDLLYFLNPSIFFSYTKPSVEQQLTICTIIVYTHSGQDWTDRETQMFSALN